MCKGIFRETWFLKTLSMNALELVIAEIQAFSKPNRAVYIDSWHIDSLESKVWKLN